MGARSIQSSDGGVESRHATACGSGPLPLAHSNGDACSALEPPNRAADTVGRYQEQKRAAGVAPSPSDAEPTFFTGTWFLVDEIELGVSVLNAKVRALKEGNKHKAAVTQKIAAEEISKVAGQIKSMADTLSRVTVQHINRRPRP